MKKKMGEKEQGDPRNLSGSPILSRQDSSLQFSTHFAKYIIAT